MQEETIQKIIDKYLEGKASADEINQLDRWYDNFDCKTDVLYIPGTEESKLAVVKGFSKLKFKLGIEGTTAPCF